MTSHAIATRPVAMAMASGDALATILVEGSR